MTAPQRASGTPSPFQSASSNVSFVPSAVPPPVMPTQLVLPGPVFTTATADTLP